jgi:hypothetical protein
VRKAAGRSIALKHSRAPVLSNASDTANGVVQVLAQLGRDKVDADAIEQLAARLERKDVKALIQGRPAMPGWMGDVILKIGAAHHG